MITGQQEPVRVQQEPVQQEPVQQELVRVPEQQERWLLPLSWQPR
jgi:hypothetical protein